MNLEYSETINEERLYKGKRLKEILDGLNNEHKNAIIGFRVVNKKIPSVVDNEDLGWVEFKTCVDVLADMGVCFVEETDMRELLDEFSEEIGDLYDDHRAWSVLTVLEVRDELDFDCDFLEGNITNNRSKMNTVPIDMIGVSSHINLVTCKFNMSTQTEKTRSKAEELRELSEQIGDSCFVCLGTLSVKVKERIENEFGSDFDRIVTGQDILDFP
ncbi:MAG TPA: hypothetical protein VFJ06_06685 [Halococcus sp.]|nr:hypothetical protein [Halococcus sp.]